MKCHNCPKPAMFLVGEEEIPLCLDCNAKYQDVLDRQQINNERIMNHLSAEMDQAMGMPGFSPQYPPRVPRVVIEGGSVVANQYNIQNSQIGILNTGHIESVHSAIGSMTSAGDNNGADAFKNLVDGLVHLDVDDDLKNKVLELLSVLASEATVPAGKRRNGAMRPLLVDLAAICGGMESLADLYAQFAPAIESLFRLG